MRTKVRTSEKRAKWMRVGMCGRALITWGGEWQAIRACLHLVSESQSLCVAGWLVTSDVIERLEVLRGQVLAILFWELRICSEAPTDCNLRGGLWQIYIHVNRGHSGISAFGGSAHNTRMRCVCIVFVNMNERLLNTCLSNNFFNKIYIYLKKIFLGHYRLIGKFGSILFLSCVTEQNNVLSYYYLHSNFAFLK